MTLMTFDGIQGNSQVKEALGRMLSEGKVPHAIMFEDVDGGCGFAMAMAFLDALMGGSAKIGKLIHPDVQFVYPVSGAPALSFVGKFRALALENPYFTEMELMEALGLGGKSNLIAVADAKDILEKLAFNSLEGGYRAVVVFLPEKMNQEAANRLLKSIEEPSRMTQFILITHSPENVQPTISSRCQHIQLMPVDREEVRENEYIAQYRELLWELMGHLEKRDLLSALEVGESLCDLPSREKQKAFCRYAAGVMRQLFLIQQGMDSLARIRPEDEARLRAAASAVKKTFARNALSALDRSMMLIDRNVNQKILFCDMVNRLYLYI